jgi:Family of unknown function (DUF5670)
MHWKSLLAIAAVLVVLWIVAVVVFKIVGFAIHLLVLAAVIFAVFALVRRGANAVRRRV